MIHVVVNPAARSGRGEQVWREAVEPVLAESGVDYRAVFSQGPGDAARLAESLTREAAGDVTLWVLGGDGTVNEVLQGLEDPGMVRLGWVPTGSSNDLARDLGLPKDPAQAARRALASPGRRMDLGVVALPDGTKRRFATACGMGFDAAVCESVQKNRAKATLNRLGLGKLTYLAVAMKELLTAQKARVTLQPDGGDALELDGFLFAAGMVHRFEGGGFQFCPQADDTDGQLDLCSVAGLPRLLVLLALPTAFFGKHFWFPGVRGGRFRSAQVRASVPLCVHTDGEVLGHFDRITVECVPGALTIL